MRDRVTLGAWVRVVTYNIHRAVGASGQPSIRAIAEVLRPLAPDVVALNEVVHTRFIADQPAALGRMLRMSHVFQKNTRVHGMGFGNAVLVRGRIADTHKAHLPSVAGEPRGLLLVSANVAGSTFTVGCTHLDPRPDARRVQLKTLALILSHLPEGTRTLLVAGDLNATAAEAQGIADDVGLYLAPAKPTFPSSDPLSAPDRVFFGAGWLLQDSFTVASEASDHVALVVDLAPSGGVEA